ncbi:MAG: hypothetical protein LBB13_01620 [Rickettsiales bacterium]|jgi:hypothetical protein|nr:hypothetical protein [Rickettsiales bacterium]
MAEKSEFTVYEYSYYKSMESALTEEKNEDGSYERMMILLCAYHDHPDDEDFFHCTVGSYICGDKIMRRVIEKELGSNNVAVTASKKLVKENEVNLVSYLPSDNLEKRIKEILKSRKNTESQSFTSKVENQNRGNSSTQMTSK